MNHGFQLKPPLHANKVKIEANIWFDFHKMSIHILIRGPRIDDLQN